MSKIGEYPYPSVAAGHYEGGYHVEMDEQFKEELAQVCQWTGNFSWNFIAISLYQDVKSRILIDEMREHSEDWRLVFDAYSGTWYLTGDFEGSIEFPSIDSVRAWWDEYCDPVDWVEINDSGESFSDTADWIEEMEAIDEGIKAYM